MIAGFTPNEILMGNVDDQLFLKKELVKQRSDFSKNYIGYMELDDILNKGVDIDPDFFLSHLNMAYTLVSSVFEAFNLIPFERYLVLTKQNNELGGFYDKSSGGFHYLTLIGYCSLLNIRRVSCKKLRTFELLRNYIHDCIHFSTYRAFRVKSINEKASSIYRSQYGFNFRNEFGRTYSSPKLTKHIPKAINLNLLMDGINSFYTRSIMDSLDKRADFDLFSSLEKAIYRDLVELKINDFGLLDNLPIAFYNEVLVPSKTFIEHWGGIPFMNMCMKAMLNGDFDLFRRYFDMKSGEENYIEKHFKQKEFKF